jgi:hypothetical protein
VLFLASDAAEHIAGFTPFVDGVYFSAMAGSVYSKISMK